MSVGLAAVITVGLFVGFFADGSDPFNRFVRAMCLTCAVWLLACAAMSDLGQEIRLLEIRLESRLDACESRP